MTHEALPQPGTVELKAAPWQAIFAVAIFALLIDTSLLLFLDVFFPATINGFFNDTNPTDILGRAIGLFEGLFFLSLGFYVWRATFKYSLSADAEGIRQSNGFRTQSARWTEVASYSLEQNPGTTERQVEIVMRNANGQVIFRPFAPIFISDPYTQQQRQLFWNYVEEQLQSKLRTG